MKDKLVGLKKFLLNNYKLLVMFVCIIILLFLIEDVMDKDIMTFDETGYSIVSKYLITDTLTPIAKIITFFGSAYWLIGLSIFLLLIIKNKKIGISISINLGLAALTNFLLKQILQRPRPIGHRIIDESGYSLPSGHSMVSMAFYGFLIYLVYKRIENKHLKSFLIALLLVLIINIGISRIYLGVHYTSDVIAGFLVAISYLIIYANTIKSLILEDKK